MRWDTMGRKIGASLLLNGQKNGLGHLLQPMESVRYWEFDFVGRNVRPGPQNCLDVSSPRLFSFGWAKHSGSQVMMLNPDPVDVKESEELASFMKLNTLTHLCAGVQELRTEKFKARFDNVWSISVIEHISGTCTDSEALKLMFQTLRPGGRLLVTFPVDRIHRIESTETCLYGTQPQMPDGRYFFQRFYDQESINSRLIDNLGVQPIVTAWFGEDSSGWWTKYRETCSQHKVPYRVRDPLEISRHFRQFPTWKEMPGMGFCGLVFEAV
jgi:SAM-dependent methyltransferase